MAEPRRLDSVPPPTRLPIATARLEALLVDGLERYFTGRYEDAIHLWTRVLFLDRSHARARAYIDRARRAWPNGSAAPTKCCRPAASCSTRARPRGRAIAALTEAVADQRRRRACRGAAGPARTRRARPCRARAGAAAGRRHRRGRAGWAWPRGHATLAAPGRLAVGPSCVVAGVTRAVQQWLAWAAPGSPRRAPRPVKLPVLIEPGSGAGSGADAVRPRPAGGSPAELDRTGPESPSCRPPTRCGLRFNNCCLRVAAALRASPAEPRRR